MSLFRNLFIIFLLFPVLGQGQDGYVIEKNISKESIHEFLDYYIDEGATLFIEDVISDPTLDFKNPDKEKFLRLGVTKDAVWLRLRIKNSTNQDTRLVIHFEDPSLYDVRQYVVSGDQYISQYSGTSVKANRKAVSGNENAFNLSLGPDEEKLIYYRIESRNFISLPVSISSFSKFYIESRTQRFIQGVYYGIIIWIIILGLYFYFLFKRPVFIYYTLSVFFLALITGIYDGITPELFHGFILATNGYYEFYFSAFSNIFSLLFMIRFLSIKDNAPFIFRATIITILSILVFLLIGLIDSGLALQLTSIFSIPVMILMLAGGYIGVRKRIGLSKYYLVAYLATSLAVTISILSLFDVITYNYYIKYTLHVGFLLNFIILAFGLNKKVVEFQTELVEKEREKEQLRKEIIEQKNKELEDEIEDRTRDIINKEINLRSILDNNTNDAIWLVDSEYRLIDFNKYMKVNFEAAYEGTVLERGTYILDLIPIEELKQTWKSRYLETMKGEEGVYLDEYPALGGGKQYFQINTYPIRDSKEVIGVSVYARNITGLKNSQEELKLRNEELEKLNKELDRFVYSASHDLKAPLSSVLGLINIFKQEKDQDNQKELLKMMESSILKLNRFIKDIENYSRNTRTEILKEDFDLKKLIDETFEDLKFLEGADKISKKITFTGPEVVCTDYQRISIILSNLINNAIRYSVNFKNAQDIIIEIDVKVNDDEVCMHIRDNGPGISEEHINQIFEMFYRVHENISGTGLGLYIVQETVIKLGGSIDVESEVGEGTTFTVVVPNNKS